MSGHKNFRILREKLEERLQADPEARLRVEEYRRAMRDALALADLRESRGVTQAELADVLEVSQANVSRVEHKDDLYLSTLSKYVAALGGRLELTAVPSPRWPRSFIKHSMAGKVGANWAESMQVRHRSLESPSQARLMALCRPRRWPVGRLFTQPETVDGHGQC